MPKYITFEDFLREKHMGQYAGDADSAPDNYDTWMCEKDIGEVVDLGNEYGELLASRFEK